MLAMYFVTSAVIDITLAILAILLALIACPFGMKPKAGVSGVTNKVKLLAYPAFVIFIAIGIAYHYLRAAAAGGWG